MPSLIILFYVSVVSCSKDNQDMICNKYFLTETTTGGISTQFFYNAEERLSQIKSSQGTTTNFVYDQSKKLKEVNTSFSKIVFYFNTSNHLYSIMSFGENGVKSDSVSIEYDQNNKIDRFNKYSGYDYHLSYYQKYKYLDDKTVQVDFYGQANNQANSALIYQGSFKYILDGKPRPYPEEYYYFSIAATNIYLSSNPISLEGFGGQQSFFSTYTYKYNSAGYPLAGNNYNYKYACEPKMNN